MDMVLKRHAKQDRWNGEKWGEKWQNRRAESRDEDLGSDDHVASPSVSAALTISRCRRHSRFRCLATWPPYGNLTLNLVWFKHAMWVQAPSRHLVRRHSFIFIGSWGSQDAYMYISLALTISPSLSPSLSRIWENEQCPTHGWKVWAFPTDGKTNGRTHP